MLVAPQVLKGSKKLILSVSSVGRIPGGYVTNHIYTWVDPLGRSVSPPPALIGHRSNSIWGKESERKSHLQLLRDGDEKKVNWMRTFLGHQHRTVSCWWMLKLHIWKKQISQWEANIGPLFYILHSSNIFYVTLEGIIYRPTLKCQRMCFKSTLTSYAQV